jgi:hypothetical protein
MRLGEAWGSLRRLLRKYSLPHIKEIVGAAGLPVHELGELHSSLPIQQLFDELDLLLRGKRQMTKPGSL